MRTLGFIRQPLKIIEISLLLLIMISIGIDYYLVEQNQRFEIGKIIDSLLLIIFWFIPIGTPIAERLRNLYLFCIWSLICILLA